MPPGPNFSPFAHENMYQNKTFGPPAPDIVWYYLPNGHWPLKRSIKQRIKRYKIFVSFLINLTTLNDQIIDKYLFFILI